MFDLTVRSSDRLLVLCLSMGPWGIPPRMGDLLVLFNSMMSKAKSTCWGGWVEKILGLYVFFFLRLGPTSSSQR